MRAPRSSVWSWPWSRAPLLADPPAAPLGLAARLVAAVLAGYLPVGRDARSGRAGPAARSSAGRPKRSWRSRLPSSATSATAWARRVWVRRSPPRPGSPLPRWRSCPSSTAATSCASAWGCSSCSPERSSSGRVSAGTPAELEDILTAGLVATLGGAVAILAIASRSDGRPGFELSATTPHRSSHGADAHPIEPE